MTDRMTDDQLTEIRTMPHLHRRAPGSPSRRKKPSPTIDELADALEAAVAEISRVRQGGDVGLYQPGEVGLREVDTWELWKEIDRRLPVSLLDDALDTLDEDDREARSSEDHRQIRRQALAEAFIGLAQKAAGDADSTLSRYFDARRQLGERFGEGQASDYY